MSIFTSLKFSHLTILVLGILLQNRAVAQVMPDNTLGPESSQLIDLSATDQLIRGGAIRDENLFHSFEQFSIGEGGRVIFDNPAPIQRVFSRVTGDLPSEILGTLASTGNADMYFLNPNGILFGPNARLNVGGSFVVSTADKFEFADLGVYSARNPGVPSPLLTISPSALQFGQIPPGEITVQSTADGIGLRVPNGESLVLLGGKVTLDGGGLVAGEGRIEVGAAQNGTIQIAPDGQLTFTVDSEQERITFKDGAVVFVSLSDKGDIQVTGRAIEIVESQLIAGIFIGLGNPDSQAGDVILTATESVRVRESFIFNNINVSVTGNGGEIKVTAPVIELLEGGQLQAVTLGRGNAGNIIIDANERLTVSGENTAGDPSGAFSLVAQTGIGNGGNVEIETTVLEVLDGGELLANTRGTGKSGSVIIDADERVIVTGERGTGDPSGIFSSVEQGGIGNGGNVEIDTAVLKILDGAQLQAITAGRGNAGSVFINASEYITFASSNGRGNPSGAFSLVAQTGIGSSGNVEIDTAVLKILDGAELRASTSGQGNAGNIIISSRERVTVAGDNSDETVSSVSSSVRKSGIGSGGNVEIDTAVLEVLRGAQLQTETLGMGQAGNVIINASETAIFSGDGVLGNSSASSAVRESGIGGGGNVEISTAVLEVLKGAQLGSGTFGQGNAGNVIINASETAIFSGEDADGFNSGAFSSVEASGIGSGGNVEIDTAVLKILDGATLSASTRGTGNAGDVIIDASETVTLVGGDRDGRRSGTFSAVEESAIGNGGDIEIDTAVLEVLNGAQLLASTAGEGDAGNVIINARETVTFAGEDGNELVSGAFTTVDESGIGSGGNVEIDTTVLNVLNGATLSSITSGRGDAGNVIISARERTTFAGGVRLRGGDVRFLSNAASLVGESGIGNGGDIKIDTVALEVLDGAQLAASTRGQGNAGNIIIISSSYIDLDQGRIRTDSTSNTGRGNDIAITTPLLTLTDQSEISTQTRFTDGGDITLTLKDVLVLTENSLISTEAGTAEAGGDGGDITINTQFIVAPPDENSDIVANAFDGDGGNVNITATGGLLGIVPRPERTPRSDITASSRNGVSGTITVQAPTIDPSRDAVELPTSPITSDVERSCRDTYGQNDFIVTGRGGLPQSPLDSATATLWQDTLAITDGDHRGNEQITTESESNAATEAESISAPLVEVQGWTRNELGQVVLVAADPQQPAVGQPLTCQG